MTLEEKSLGAGKLLMLILLILAAILATANMIIGTMGYDYHMETVDIYDEETEEWDEEYVEVGSGDLVFNELRLWDCIVYLQNIAPIVLLLTLTVGGSQMRVLCPITLGILGLYSIISIFDGLLPIYAFIPVLLLLVLAIYSVAAYPYKKGLVIPFIVGAAIVDMLRFARFWEGSEAQIEEGLALYAIYPITMLLTYLITYVAMLVFLFKLDKPKVNINALPADQALRLLYDRLVRGEITSEEYAAQRAQIINNL